MKRRGISRLENRQNANTLRKRKTQEDRENIREENGHIKNTALMPTNKRCTSRGKHANLRLRQAEGLADSVIKRVLRRSVSSSESANWNLAGRARSQCVTVLSVVRSAPAAARNGTGQFSVLNDKFQFDVLLFYADSHNSD